MNEPLNEEKGEPESEIPLKQKILGFKQHYSQNTGKDSFRTFGRFISEHTLNLVAFFSSGLLEFHTKNNKTLYARNKCSDLVIIIKLSDIFCHYLSLII